MKKLIMFAFGRKVFYEFHPTQKELLTTNEKHLLKELLTQKKCNLMTSVVAHISERYHLDFIGWDKKGYNDVLICKNR